LSHNTSEELFRNAPIPKAVLGNAIPAVVSMIMIVVYNLADTYFIGQTQDSLMVTAISIGTPVFLLFLAIGVLFGIGGTSLIARSLGEGKKDKAKHISAFCYWSSLVIGLIGMVLMLVFNKPISYIAGASEESLSYTMQYFGVIAFAAPFLIISEGFSNIIRSEGKPKVAMMGIVIGNIINIIKFQKELLLMY